MTPSTPSHRSPRRGPAGAAALAVSLAASVAAQGGWKDLTDQPVPEIHVQTWLNTGDEAPSSSSLKGKVWLLEFFATW